MRALTCFSLAVIGILLFSSCSSIEKIQGSDKAETFYLRGEAYLKEGMYQQALDNFNIVKNKFPYSRYAKEAELKIGDTYYQKGEYLESQRIYGLFYEFHPEDNRRDYAIFMKGMSYYKLLPSAIDRDLSYSKNALTEFKELMQRFPESTYFDETLVKYNDIRTRLAEKEIYIGNFYRKRGAYLSAVERFKTVIDNYSDLSFTEKMYYEIANCYTKLGETEDANYYIDILLIKYPGGKYAESVKKLKRGL